MITQIHAPVLLEEVVKLLQPAPGKLLLDGTAGAGGHAFALAEAGATVIALDRDPLAIELTRERLAPFGARCRLLRRNFSAARSALDELGIGAVDGTLLDLGVSSMQLDFPDRGFGFRADGPLDMRMSPDEGPSARQLLAESDEGTISEVLRALGEEAFARPIARSIKRAVRMETTLDLVRAVEAAVPRSRWPKRIHVATRTFQGIRLWVNRELESLDRFLRDLPGLLGAGARAVIISFHSLEDRAVKLRFRDLEGGCTCPPKLPICVCSAAGRFRVLTKRAVVADDTELAHNRRARSARLRAVERIAVAA
jgi:16S rRNA (cytosine1402-N4)-methyltransferase